MLFGILSQRLSPRQTKLLIGGLIILVVLAAWVFLNVRSPLAYYLTLSELRAQGPSARRVRVTGTVVGETIQWHPERLELAFEISDGEDCLVVYYHGSRPDMFRGGAEAVVEGRYVLDGHFEADRLLLKCPSKYRDTSRRLSWAGMVAARIGHLEPSGVAGSGNGHPDGCSAVVRGIALGRLSGLRPGRERLFHRLADRNNSAPLLADAGTALGHDAGYPDAVGHSQSLVARSAISGHLVRF